MKAGSKSLGQGVLEHWVMESSLEVEMRALGSLSFLLYLDDILYILIQ